MFSIYFLLWLWLFPPPAWSIESLKFAALVSHSPKSSFLSVFVLGDLSNGLKAILDQSTLYHESQDFVPAMFLFEDQTYCFIQVHFVSLTHHSHLNVMRDRWNVVEPYLGLRRRSLLSNLLIVLYMAESTFIVVSLNLLMTNQWVDLYLLSQGMSLSFCGCIHRGIFEWETVPSLGVAAPLSSLLYKEYQFWPFMLVFFFSARISVSLILVYWRLWLHWPWWK